MLSKKNRLTRVEFEAFTAHPNIQTVYNKLGTLKYSSEGHKLSVVTSSKHEKLAIRRNKFRRRIYNHFSKVTVPVSGVLYASKLSYSLENEETKALFDGLITKTQSNTK